MKTIHILVACGGGIATSTFAATEIESIAKEVGVPVKITKGQIINVPANAKNYDLCCVTSKFNQDIGTRLIQVGALITGFNEEKVKKLIAETLIELSKE